VNLNAIQWTSNLVTRNRASFAAVIALLLGMPEKTAKNHDYPTEEHKPGAKNSKNHGRNLVEISTKRAFQSLIKINHFFVCAHSLLGLWKATRMLKA
jgi:hypothetical protein